MSRIPLVVTLNTFFFWSDEEAELGAQFFIRVIFLFVALTCVANRDNASVCFYFIYIKKTNMCFDITCSFNGIKNGCVL